MRLFKSISKRLKAGVKGFIYGPPKPEKPLVISEVAPNISDKEIEAVSTVPEAVEQQEEPKSWHPGWVFQPNDTPEAYQARLIKQLCAETEDGEAACSMILDEIERSLPAEDRDHAQKHLVRYLQTYLLAPSGPGHILDVGGPSIHNIPLAKLKNWKIDIIEILEIDYERDPFPYADESKEGVLLCEVIEHFVIDPLFCLNEINRILKPGGFLILTTPNVASWFSIYQALEQRHPNRWPVYAGAGFKERNHIHSREYLASELKQLFAAAGFDCQRATTLDYGIAPAFCPIPGYDADDRGETIFLLGTKSGQPKMRYAKPVYLEDVPYK